MEAFHSRSIFNLIEPSTGWKVGFVLRKDRPFSLAEFERRTPANVGGTDIYAASAEDTMLAKLEWGKASSSDRQFDDAAAIAATQDVEIDYLTRWADERGVAEELNSVLERGASLRAEKNAE